MANVVNELIVGQELILHLGVPKKSKKGRLLHVVLRVARTTQSQSVRKIFVGTSVGLLLGAALWAGLEQGRHISFDSVQKLAHLALGEASNVEQQPRPELPTASEISKPNQVASQDDSAVAVDVVSPIAPQPLAAALPTPPGGVIPYEVPANANFAVPAIHPVDASRILADIKYEAAQNVAVAQGAKSSGESPKQEPVATPMLVLDVSKSAEQTEQGSAEAIATPKSTEPGSGEVMQVATAAAVTDGENQAQALPELKDPENPPVEAPNVVLPSLNKVAQQAEIKQTKPETPTANESNKSNGLIVDKSNSVAQKEEPKTDQSKPAAKVEEEKTKPTRKAPVIAKRAVNPQAVAAVKASEEPTVRHRNTRSSQRLYDEDDAGFAQPIRERVVGAQRQNARPQNARLEVLSVTNGSIIVTNPRTNLPIEVRIGARLPNGQILTGVDPSSGRFSTDGN